ncbi:hypothetical protein [Arcticibacter tournemirensis]
MYKRIVANIYVGIEGISILIFIFSLLALGAIIVLWLYLGNYITLSLLLRALSIYMILLVGYVLSTLYIKKALLKWVFIALLMVANIFYVRFFYVADLCILLVPEDFTGNISITMKVDSSKNEIRPLNGVVTFELLNNPRIQTRSNFDVKFTSITIAKGSKDTLVPQRGFQFINGRSIVSKGTHIITGSIIKRK